ncbi:MAG: hypothetical protein GF375_06305, partial [Candidatus Omnitrophica bacterium]|nr:hypothetical protein [Candidatus Omnitrophota bacterium]MBD3269587.1 hypothetical protein [Candidatus Omnitrophota bacterium]
MSRKPLSEKVKRLVLKERKNNPSLGIRAIAKKIQAEHNIKISKSSVHKILVENGLRDKPGRKRAVLSYKKNLISECGLILLRAVDDYVGLFDHLSEEFKVFMPRLNKEEIKKLVIFTAFSSYTKSGAFRQCLEDRDFLRLTGLYHL